MARILIVDDDALVRAGLTMILQSADDLEVVGEATDGSQVAEAVQLHRPDVILMDIRMPRMDGLTATAALQTLSDPPKVIVLTTFDLDDFVFRALEAGAAGFLLKDTPPLELIAAVRVVAAGDGMLSPGVTRRLAGLTDREREVLAEVGQGGTNGDIGRNLFMSEATVKAHVSRLLVKLGVTNRVQIAILAHDAGLLD